jgi:hypothetical protein
MGGTNDLLLGRSVVSIINNLELMIKEGVNINSEIIIGIPPKIIGEMANSLFSPSHLYDYAENELLTLKNELIKLCNAYMKGKVKSNDDRSGKDYAEGTGDDSEGNSGKAER